METFKIPISEIYGNFRGTAFKEKVNGIRIRMGNQSDGNLKGLRTALLLQYDVEGLKESILEKGMLTPVRVIPINNFPTDKDYTEDARYSIHSRNKYITNKYKYLVRDGNHRCNILKDVYGEDYLITCTWHPKWLKEMSNEDIKKLRELR